MPGFVVGTSDFRAALSSALVHAGQDPRLPVLQRIRLDLDAQNLTVSAIDQFTAGLAIVSVVTFVEPELEPIDLSPDDADKILSLFKGGKEDPDEPEYLLQITTTETHVVVTDVSGLIDGRVVKLPKTPVDDSFPDVAMLISRCHNAPLSLPDDLAVNGKYLARFKTAAAAYRNPLLMETHAGWRALLIRCGESFVGMLMPVRRDEDSIAQWLQWSRAWTVRLPDPLAVPRNATVKDRDGKTSKGPRLDLRNGVGYVVVGQVGDDPDATDESEDPGDETEPETSTPDNVVQLGSTDPDSVESIDDPVPLEQLLHATELVVESQFGSISMIRRKLRIGHAKAVRVIEQLEEAQIIGRANGSKARQVLVDRSGLHAALEVIRADYKAAQESDNYPE